MQRLRLLNRFFFQELGFAGNVNDYYDAKNSYLHFVLQTRRGIPITLAVLYIELASQIGLHARGVSFPGHFLVKLRMPQGEVVIDPFTGQSLSREELDELLVPYRRREGLPGEFDVPLGAVPAGRAAARHHRPHAAQPEGDPSQQRGLAAPASRCSSGSSSCCRRPGRSGATAASPPPQLGAVKAAVADLSTYLENVPHAGDRFAINERLLELGHGDPSRLH